MEAYIAAGFDPAQFWGLTPRLYLAQMRGALERLEQEQKAREWTVWHTAALVRAEQLPDFANFSGGRVSQAKPQTPKEVLAMGEALARAWGVERV